MPNEIMPKPRSRPMRRVQRWSTAAQLLEVLRRVQPLHRHEVVNAGEAAHTDIGHESCKHTGSDLFLHADQLAVPQEHRSRHSAKRLAIERMCRESPHQRGQASEPASIPGPLSTEEGRSGCRPRRAP